jgi:signal transduction histidine kinase
LRSPLTSILGWVQAVQARRDDEAIRARALDTIQRNAKALAELVNELLETSRLVTGQVQLEMEPLDVGPVVEAVLDSCAPAAEAKGVRLEASVVRAQCWVTADPGRLQQIVANLLSNAVKFTPAGGRVQVRVETPSAADCEIVVMDTGVGIRPEFLPYVFDRFRQAYDVKVEPGGGLGLGLAIVRQLAELHGGTAKAESDGAGRGATFRVRLPRLSEDPGARGGRRSDRRGMAGEWPPEAAAVEGCHVLVVEDEADSRDFLRLVLEAAGARVTVAASVKEALDLLAHAEPRMRSSATSVCRMRTVTS